MKKNFRIGATSAAILMAMGMSTAAQAGDDADATASVEVLRPLVLTNTAGLDFGAVAVNGVGQVALTIDGFGAADLNCDATIVCTGTTSLAAFDVTAGSPGRTVTVDMPAAGIDLVHLNPLVVGSPDALTETIELTDFVTDADETDVLDGGGAVIGQTYSVDLGAAGAADEGEATFQVGGTLNFGGDELAGSYEGTFNVSVEYS